MQLSTLISTCLIVASSLHSNFASALVRRNATSTCQKTKVAILGAGTAGITAAQALSNQSVTEFVIVEYNGDIGGRVAHTTFGAKPDGTPYVVELGANWVQGLVTGNGPENPIWTLAQIYNLTNTYSNYSSIQTFNETGAVDFTSLISDYQANAYSSLEQDAGNILKDNLQDHSVRAGLSLAGWKPKKDMQAQAVEWWSFDWEYASTPERSSEVFAVVNYNTTFYQYSGDNNYVFDERGFNAFIKGEASTFLTANDTRLLLNTVVTNITWGDAGVTVYNKDGSCIEADYAICTFSVGVLQNDAVSFDPKLPTWKQEGIETFSMATYTKVFLQFPADKIFWNASNQFFLYADPEERGYYPVWQSLDGPGFLEGSGILFVTVVQEQSYRVEQQTDEQTKEEVLAVLRDMFGSEKVPAPIAFMYPRWSLEPWAYGSYSNWPPGTTLEMHENLRANVGRLYFAGEGTSSEYFGFLQGAWFEGQAAGLLIADCLAGNCTSETKYEVLHGTTDYSEYDLANGWQVTSFQTNGL
ncbi:MAG: hypothetical protein M1830_010204 [Pleopsidium flavum]|nr:MAG: hypothetical protein M1830_010204 [Pleopsidium flavum]